MATAINSSLQDTQEHSGYPSISIFRQELNHKLKIITAWFSRLFVATTTLRSYAIGLFILLENVCLNVNATIKVSPPALLPQNAKNDAECIQAPSARLKHCFIIYSNRGIFMVYPFIYLFYYAYLFRNFCEHLFLHHSMLNYLHSIFTFPKELVFLVQFTCVFAFLSLNTIV